VPHRHYHSTLFFRLREDPLFLLVERNIFFGNAPVFLRDRPAFFSIIEAYPFSLMVPGTGRRLGQPIAKVRSCPFMFSTNSSFPAEVCVSIVPHSVVLFRGQFFA